MVFPGKKTFLKMETRSILMPPMKQEPVVRSRNTFLDYYKTVLEKVSFDYHLFIKEYRKAMNILGPEERDALDGWIESRRLHA
jgi:hypothetical protein